LLLCAYEAAVGNVAVVSPPLRERCRRLRLGHWSFSGGGGAQTDIVESRNVCFFASLSFVSFQDGGPKYFTYGTIH
jgi:hypothetical protein